MLPSEVFRRFRHAPIGATKALFDGDRIGVNTTPLQADEFTDSQACPHCDEDHCGVRLGSPFPVEVDHGRYAKFGTGCVAEDLDERDATHCARHCEYWFAIRARMSC